MSTPQKQRSPRPPQTPQSGSRRRTPSQRQRDTTTPSRQARYEREIEAISAPAEWQQWPELTLEINDLPQNITAAKIWEWFAGEGEIAFIDISESRNSSQLMFAKVRYSPPPKTAFWALNGGRCWVEPRGARDFPNGLCVYIRVAKMIPDAWIQSPVSRDRVFPIKMTLHPTSVQFGSLLSPSAMKVFKTLDTRPNQQDLKLEVNLKLKRFTVFFPMEIRYPVEVEGTQQEFFKYTRQYKLTMDFSRMKRIYKTNQEDGACALVLPLQFPPQYYWKKLNVRSTFSEASKNWNASEAWYRATDILEKSDHQLRYPVALNTDFEDPGFIDIARWTTFRFVLQGQSEKEQSLNNMLTDALGDWNITSEVVDDFEISVGTQAELWKNLDHPPVAQGGGALALLQLSSLSFTQLEFEVRYQLEVCISRGILNEHSISTEFLQQLAQLTPLKARLRLEYFADQNEYVQDPMTVLSSLDADAYYPHQKVPHYCALVRKAVITPTSVRYNTPVVETSNRVMRKYSHIQDRFLRVQFAEELEQGKISYNKDQNDEVFKRVMRTLYQGIRIGDRVYEFLAFGNSQLRSGGAYFFCPTQHVSCDDIRNWMGRFDHIKIIAKYAARLGQCFSTTRDIRGISVPTIRPIPDIERNGYCFTDGVGKISPFVSQMIIEEMSLDVFDKPSAFQFRMGGYKGVLAVWPIAKGTEVHVRESQEKFKADFNGLEIIRCAKYATATLNQQTILILESLKVPTLSFTNLLDQQLEAYEKAMVNNHAAVDILTKFVDENQTTLIIAELLKAGFKSSKVQEPFVVNVLNLWRSWSLKILKEKARIHVEKSAFVLGCVDETGTLRGHSTATEGTPRGTKESDLNKLPQIFLQITDSKEYNKTRIIKGVCIVGRNPSLHPGDIRVVQAVDNPKLHHLKDVVVFPSKGDRPVPNMLSGGDLDGDDFFVIWDKTLLPEIWNYPPMNYTGSKPQPLDRDVNVNDLRDFFVLYMKNDSLPLIATSHRAFADELDAGPMSKKCLELCELHSKAVDYPKTGDPAIMKREHNARRWPHWMEKNKTTTYRSNKALGVIYDKVIKKDFAFNPIWENSFDQRITKRFTLDNETLKAARKIKTQYDISVRRLLSQHDLKTEFELWTAFPMSSPATSSGYKFQEDMGQEYDALKHRFREICYEAAGGKQSEQVDRFVAAMYTVTEEEIKIALYEHNRGPINDAGRIVPPRKLEARSMPLISFPWIFHWVLIRIALEGQYDPKASMLAAARKKEHHSQATGSKQPQVSAGGEEETKETPIDFGDDVHTQLPDGTVIHRGQPLALFPSEEEATGDEGSISDEGRASRSPTVERHEADVGNETEDGGRDETSDGIEGREGVDMGGPETVEIHVQESAMDRLARLVVFDDDD